MKASIVTTAFVCMFGLGVASADTPQVQTMRGCLEEGSATGTFRLTDLGPDGPQAIEITEGTADLVAHVGHKVEVTGTMIADPAVHAMKVTAVKHLEANCR